MAKRHYPYFVIYFCFLFEKTALCYIFMLFKMKIQISSVWVLLGSLLHGMNEISTVTIIKNPKKKWKFLLNVIYLYFKQRKTVFEKYHNNTKIIETSVYLKMLFIIYGLLC